MMASTNPFRSFGSREPRAAWRERWLVLRDLLGGALMLAVWLALWTVTWAAIAGPLAPVDPRTPPVASART